MYAALEALLKRAMGLDVASIGSSAMERAVQKRLRACHLTDVQAYTSIASGSPAELQQLIEAIVVPETWFFRDAQAFALVARWAVENWSLRNPHGHLRILSLPCSSGEEPFSIAMSLLAAGLPPSRFSIDAVDISGRAIAVGQRGLYGKNSFRGDDLEFRATHFVASEGGWQLDAAVRSQVQFRQSNLFAADSLPGAGLYDVIFCRNVLIYFDRATQDRAVLVLLRLLTPDGLVFVAPCETSLALDHDLVAIKAPLAFAFRRRPSRPVTTDDASRPRGLLPPPAPRRDRVAPAMAGRPLHDPEAAMDQAEALADAGRIAEATVICHEHLKLAGPDARAYRLIALMCAAEANVEEAVANYRKALYLNPDDLESLIHLSLLVGERGDAAAAAVLQQRAQRIRVRTARKLAS